MTSVLPGTLSEELLAALHPITGLSPAVVEGMVAGAVEGAAVEVGEAVRLLHKMPGWASEARIHRAVAGMEVLIRKCLEDTAQPGGELPQVEQD